MPFQPPAESLAEQRGRVRTALQQGDLGEAGQAAEQLVLLSLLADSGSALALRAQAGVLALAGDYRGAARLIAGDVEAEAALAVLYGRSGVEEVTRAGSPWALTRQAHRAVACRDRVAARELRTRLAPFDGTLITLDDFGCDLPVAAHLARLALVTGDIEVAYGHAAEAVAFARRVGSPPLRAWSSMTLSLALRFRGDYAEAAAARDAALDAGDSVGVRLPPDLPAGDPESAALVRRGGCWQVDSPLGSGQVPALVGMEQLARVLVAAGPLSAYELANPVLRAPLRPHLTEDARQAFQERLGDQHDAAQWGAFAAEIRCAAGLDEPDRGGAVLVPQSVGHSIVRAIRAIGAVAPALADHLNMGVYTRDWCLYRPAPGTELTWTVIRE